MKTKATNLFLFFVFIASLADFGKAFSTKCRRPSLSCSQSIGSSKTSTPILHVSKTTPSSATKWNNKKEWTKLFALPVSDDSDDNNKPFISEFNPIFGTFFVLLMSFAIFLAPGEFGGQIDNDILNAFIQNPIQPEGVNKLFMIIFNLLGLLPMIISCLMFPQGSKQGLPAAPFAVASAGLGFFGLAPYLTLRAPPVDSKVLSEMGWGTKNVLENKIFNWLLVASLISLPFSLGVVSDITADPTATTSLVSGLTDLYSTSKLATVSSCDLLILTLSAALLIPRDYKLRAANIVDSYGNPLESNQIESKANQIAALTLLAPVLGAAIYCVWRPALPEE